MVPLLVILTIVVFAIVDIATRLTIRRFQETKRRRQRQEALDIGLRLDYTDEATSLKRVEVAEPKARILAVDDEAIVLDSFRKILVLAGYSVDTVETGPEALGLIRKRDYDFVFTDLKMPDMDGLDVVKAVKHMRPEIDVAMITGYATIESAVDAMKYGAMDYVQKPFTADELVEFVDKLVIRREDRLEREARPEVRLVTPSRGLSRSEHDFNVPAGIFVAPEHTWINIQPDGMLLIGVDDFAQKLLGIVEGVTLPHADAVLGKGDSLFTLHRGGNELTFPSPAGGKVAFLNESLASHPERVNESPFEDGWVCAIDPAHLPEDLQGFRIGADAIAWYEDEIDRFRKAVEVLREKSGETKNDEDRIRWRAFSQRNAERSPSTNKMSSVEGQEKTQ
ncbi:MAG: response regulator [Rhodothermales bacterium]